MDSLATEPLFNTYHEEVIVPSCEIAAYETLWARYGSVHKMAEIFKKYHHALPTKVAEEIGIGDHEIEDVKDRLRNLLPFPKYSALFYKDFEYPQRLRDAKNPLEVLYYQGNLDLLSSDSVSVVGSRKATPEGLLRAQKIAKLLVENGFTVMSGLAEGIDTAAHQTAIREKGNTIAVIGTPLNECYPKSNRELQSKIAESFLVISQVPFYYASLKDWRENRKFFPERNATMSALSSATVIVEASDTSGTLFQARAAIQQGRKLFILKSCFEKGLKWPATYLKKGAIKIESGEDLLKYLKS